MSVLFERHFTVQILGNSLGCLINPRCLGSYGYGKTVVQAEEPRRTQERVYTGIRVLIST